MAAARGKTICFIDNANIFFGQQEAGWRIDWEKFARHLERDGEIWQTYFFASEHDPPLQNESSFYQFLKEELRWEVMLYPLGRKTISCSRCAHTEMVLAEKGVDVGLATKMLILAINHAYETAILVAGDRDYLETVKYIKGLGLRVEIIAWRSNISDDLADESSEHVIYLENLKRKIEKQ
jgi:uncharacterized LabA/DUF88 family protein